VRIAGIEVRRYAFQLDPPFKAAWDPTPRRAVEASVVIARSDDGLAGYASGDNLPDAEVLERLLVGLDPLRVEVVREICESVDFHGGRPWTAEVAVWDLAARALGQPLWRLLGGRSERLLAYASTGELTSAEERVRRVVALRDRGVRAVKLRFHDPDWRRDIALVERVRDGVGTGSS
jgi:D-galactarolactone cycloisomerase